MRNRVVGLEMELRALKEVLGVDWQPGRLLRLESGEVVAFVRLVQDGAEVMIEGGRHTVLPMHVLPR